MYAIIDYIPDLFDQKLLLHKSNYSLTFSDTHRKVKEKSLFKNNEYLIDDFDDKSDLQVFEQNNHAYNLVLQDMAQTTKAMQETAMTYDMESLKVMNADQLNKTGKYLKDSSENYDKYITEKLLHFNEIKGDTRKRLNKFHIKYEKMNNRISVLQKNIDTFKDKIVSISTDNSTYKDTQDQLFLMNTELSNLNKISLTYAYVISIIERLISVNDQQLSEIKKNKKSILASSAYISKLLKETEKAGSQNPDGSSIINSSENTKTSTPTTDTVSGADIKITTTTRD